jgi:hypothetical protein
MNHLAPTAWRWTCISAVWQPRPGRNPWDRSENWTSKYASSSMRTTSATSLSDHDVIPSGRNFPFLFGMYTRLAGRHRYDSERSAPMIASILARDMPSAVSPETPGVIAPSLE